MFRLQNVDEYASLQALISIDESIQPIIVLGCSIINVVDVVVDTLDGEEDDGIDNLEDFDSNFDSEN
jgi:hypothetical protein